MSSEDKVKVVLDHRERSIKAPLEKVFDDVEVAPLPVGDIVLLLPGYGVLVERKSISDFIGSIRSNRLWEQLLKIMKAKRIFGRKIKRRILLVHGSILDNLLLPGNEGFNDRFWASISGALMEITYVYDIPVFFLEDDDAVPTFLRILSRRENSGSNNGFPKPRWFRRRSRYLPEKEQRVYFLSSLPNVGEVLARNLLDHFGSIAAVANATVEELQEVEGIGKKKATQIYEAFH
ncbi:MAG TPA: ERCC4-type nuclease [Thermoplasmatales archaeon]|nr:ERCC4-type nuclease [Thermoplasmatales archaeon]